MTVVYLGELSVGAAVPGADAAVLAGIAGIQDTLATLQAQLGVLTGFTPIALTLDQQLELAKQVVASVGLAISVGLPEADMSMQLALTAAQIAALTAQIAGIQAQLDILLGLQAPLAVAGVHAYAYDGATANFGNELDAALELGVPGGAGGDHANAVVLVTTIPGTWDAMGEILKVTP